MYLGKAARRSVWHYLADREDGKDPVAPLIVGKFDRPMNRDGLRQLIGGLGERANVRHCYPHRFRHTLQALLGHGSLDMVQHYARIAEVDVEMAHRRASPADNWRL